MTSAFVFLFLVGISLTSDSTAADLPRSGLLTVSQLVAKFGACPPSSAWDASHCLWTKCSHKCDTDASCPGVQKCCNTQSCCRTCQDPICAAPIVKPGKCPKSPLFGSCGSECQSDESCPRAEKCCVKTPGCGRSCQEVEAPPVVHVGMCPAAGKTTKRGWCSITCTSDQDCQLHQKCCSNGCGRSCRNAIEIPPVIHDGMCPPQNATKPGNFSGICTSDGQCKITERCCSSACGRSCQTTVEFPPD
ncbi:hypothetical protein BV898_13015 [Hypsibius exemplaris]|uniref:WAP domain-containing protein n=1 Tax=Hypsibius exemplaris TaxID=2072580 RepID=A0A1W0WBV7_HYPEX|nr:hypothetical protein BV898_13015 [Hypsibius exemplaris]